MFSFTAQHLTEAVGVTLRVTVWVREGAPEIVRMAAGWASGVK
jgi:hypothetical protein